MAWMSTVGDWVYWTVGVVLAVLALIRIGTWDIGSTETYRIGSFLLLGVAALFMIAART